MSEDGWVCDPCQYGIHQACFSRTICACPEHTPSSWLSPERRAQLRNGAVPRIPVEEAFCERLDAYRKERTRAKARRG